MKNVNSKNVELLAPAGSYEAFIAAVNAGADAVYMGLKNFNARVMTANFDIEEYKEAINYAHKRDVKVYLTLNTLLVDGEIKQALEQVYDLYTVGLDGVIVQDLGVADLIHKLMPDLSLHASTQMSICTLDQVKMLEKLGFERVVLARELTIDEIEQIVSNTKLEVEVFVHGALCVSVSGQCLMSAMIGQRSANRGSCAGPCRKKYSLYSSNGKQVQNSKYILSKKDIFGLDKIEKLINAGVYSLKIEGRNKSPEYVAGVVKNYREAIDNGYDEKQDEQVLQLFNRSGKSDGYLNGVRYRQSISENSPKNTGLFLGTVEKTKNGYIQININKDIDLHDGIETEDGKSSTIITCIRDNNFNIVNKKVLAGNTVWLGDIKGVKVGQKIYKTSSASLNEKYKKYSTSNIKRLEYDITVAINKDKPLAASTKEGICIELDYIPETAITSDIDENKIKDVFSKTENTSVKFNISTDVHMGLFVPVSKLNELRNALIAKIEQSKTISKTIEGIADKIEQVLYQVCDNVQNNAEARNLLHVYRYNPNIDYVSYYINEYKESLDILYINAPDFKNYEEDIIKYLNKCKVYFVIPNVTLKNIDKYIRSNLERLVDLGISGILIGNIGYLEQVSKLKEKYNIEIVADYSMNITNIYTGKKLKQMGVDIITPLTENGLDVEKLYKSFACEQIHDLVTVMTTRYCVISSFVKNSIERKECDLECKKNNYYLLDEQSKRYDIITDNLDCISKFVTQIPNTYAKGARNRHNVI